MIRFDMRSFVVFGAAVATSLACVGALHLAYSADTQHIADRPVMRPLAAPAVLRAADGHYWAEADIEGKTMRMLVDTGASMVTLSRRDARVLGVIPHETDFSQVLATAAGPVKAAPVVLRDVSIAGVRMKNVDAVIVDRDLPAPLLGMSFLGRLSAFEARPEGIVLKG